MPTIGPTLPPSLPTKRKADTSAPTSPAASPKRQRNSLSKSTSPSPKHRQQIGPAPPPADLSTFPPPDASSSSDDDSDIGPALPPSPSSHPTNPSSSNHPKTNTALPDDDPLSAPKPTREEWMLLPPSADGLNSTRMDPTKLKNRKFQTGKSASTRPPTNPSSSSGGISAVWTETPEQKRQRLEDEVLGRRPLASGADNSADGGGEERARRRGREERDREEEKRAREFNERHDRGRALMDEGKWTGRKGGEREEEDDPSKRAFDREKDMKVGRAVGYRDKKEMLRKARGMGERFAGGSYL